MINPGLIFPHISQYLLILMSEMLIKVSNRIQILICLQALELHWSCLLTSVSFTVDHSLSNCLSLSPSLFLYVMSPCPLYRLIQALKHKPCSTYKFELESCHNSDRTSTGSTHSCLDYWSKYWLWILSGLHPWHGKCYVQINSVISLLISSLYLQYSHSVSLSPFPLVPSFLISGCLTFSLAVVSFFHFLLTSLLFEWACD